MLHVNCSQLLNYNRTLIKHVPISHPVPSTPPLSLPTLYHQWHGVASFVNYNYNIFILFFTSNVPKTIVLARVTPLYL